LLEQHGCEVGCGLLEEIGIVEVNCLEELKLWVIENNWEEWNVSEEANGLVAERLVVGERVFDGVCLSLGENELVFVKENVAEKGFVLGCCCVEGNCFVPGN
jgi:hypothetical protein